VFEDRVLRRKYGPKRDEIRVKEGLRKLPNELHNLYSCRNIIRIIESLRMSWAGYIALMGRREIHTGF
jgi:hypothetical protein